MQITCLQENLNKGLSLVNRFVSTKAQLPILSNILIKAKEGKIILYATNLESGISVEINGKVEKDGEITLPAKTIVEYISQLPSETVTIKAEEGNIKVSCGKFQATISGFPPEEFPPFPQTAGKTDIRFTTKEISSPVSWTVFAAAIDESRPALSGVKIFADKKEIILAATDGFRLSVVKVKKESSEAFDLLLPARTFLEIIRIVNEEKIEEFNLEVAKEANQAIFLASRVIVVCRLIDGNFPNFTKIIPAAFTTKIIINKEELLKAVKTAAIFAREAANIIKLTIQNSVLRIEANAPQVGENSVEVEAKIEGEDGEIAFNSRFLLDYLNNVSGEEVVFEMNGSLSPGMFTIVGNNSYQHIIMPVRVQT